MTTFGKGNIRGGKLTPEQVVWGRAQYELYTETRGREGFNMRQIAEVQQVSRETVARYLRGETWKQFTNDHQATRDMQDAALLAAAVHKAPDNDSPEIQASLAKLAKLGITPTEPQDGTARADEDKGNGLTGVATDSIKEPR